MPAGKLGRNDACFCGSGKKYKFCCMRAQEPAPADSSMPFPTVAEAEALRTLLASSRPFRAFYQAERPLITAPLHWTTASIGNPGLAAQAIRLPDGSANLLCVRQVPVPPDQAFAVAHELATLGLDAEGFPFVTAPAEQQAVAALLNTLLRDPLAEARLQRYGFDVGRKIHHDIAAALVQLPHATPPDQASTPLWVLTYAGQVLVGQASTDAVAAKQVAVFKEWFAAHQPAIAASGNAVVEQMQQLGFDTPERMAACFAWLGERFQLPDRAAVSGYHAAP